MSFWTQVTSCAPPRNTLLRPRMSSATFVDSYVVRLSHAHGISTRRLTELALTPAPAWLNFLLQLRDTLVSPFGVKTTAAIRDTASSERRIDYFPITDETADEVVVGEDDRHLNFRASFLRSEAQGHVDMYATTVVHCNNLFGRVYLLAITPFHNLVVRCALARLKDKIDGS
ncbi:hypothetical protein JCM24511_08053 [Saitozyma sp. JCM 24511]|nr:hypothetical protein JCM24511_08053 [Saitozyma sp. JCM 24511]